jgi:hypothetical protein
MGEHRLHLRRVGDVGLDDLDLRPAGTQRGGGGLGLVGRTRIVDRYRCARRRQRLGGGASDATRRAGDQRAAPVEPQGSLSAAGATTGP